jgi:hypothetical protein
MVNWLRGYRLWISIPAVLALAGAALALTLLPGRGMAQAACCMPACETGKVCDARCTCVDAAPPSALDLLRESGRLVAGTLAAGIAKIRCLLVQPPDPETPTTVPLFAWHLWGKILEGVQAHFHPPDPGAPEGQHPPEPGKGFRAYLRAVTQAQRAAARYALEGPKDVRLSLQRFEGLLAGRSEAVIAVAKQFLALASQEANALADLYTSALPPIDPDCQVLPPIDPDRAP